MGHARMYADDDPFLTALRSICLALPETVEVEAWGRPTFRAGTKIFAVFQGTDEHLSGLVFKPQEAERPALLADSRFYVPPYFGASGWLALDLEAGAVDWAEVAELVEDSYRQVALKRMVRMLDVQGPSARP